jgi:transcriptional regulator with XRE-family HTH domain
MNLEKKIKFIRNHPELTLQEMADKLKVTKSNVWRIAFDNDLRYKEAFRQGGRRRALVTKAKVPVGCFDVDKFKWF